VCAAGAVKVAVLELDVRAVAVVIVPRHTVAESCSYRAGPLARVVRDPAVQDLRLVHVLDWTARGVALV